MASWSIEQPDYGATIGSDGKATFKPNTSNDPRDYTIKYTSDNGTVCTMTVTQQGNVCSFTYTPSTDPIPLEGGDYEFGTLGNVGSQTITVSLTSDSRQFVNGDLTVSGDKVVGNVKQNGDPSAYNIPSREIKYTLYADDTQCGGEYSNIQEGKTCTCQCTDLSVSPASLSWTSDETSDKTITIAPGCTTDVTVYTGDTSWFHVTVNGDTITVRPDGKNTTGDKSEEIVVKFYACGKSCDAQFKHISLTQPCSCQCTDLSVNPTSLTWAYDEGSDVSKTIEITPGCIDPDDIAVNTTSTSWFHVSVDGNIITAYPTDTNTGLTNISEQIVVSFKACGKDCTAYLKTINLTQPAQGCTCGNITVGANPSAWEWNEYTESASTDVAINDPNNCITDITVSQPDHFAASISQNRDKVTIYPTGINDTLGTISKTVTLSYTAGTQTDCSKDILVSQKTSDCDCDDVPVYFPNAIVGLDARKYQIGMILGSPDCDTGLTMYSSNSQVLGWEINDENDVFVNLASTTEPTVITFGYKVDGKDCGERYLLRRICPCPIDNCWTEDVYEHPMHVDFAYKDYPGTTDRAASPHTGDSILIPVNKLRYNGTILRGATIEYTPYPVITGGYPVVNTGLEVGDVIENAGGYSWVTIIIRKNHEYGCPTIDYYAGINDSDSPRDAIINFDVDLDGGNTVIDETCLCEGKTGEEWEKCINENIDWRNGLVPCEAFTSILRQAPNGKKYRRTCVDQYTGDSTYILYNWDEHVDDCSTKEGSTNPCGKDCS